MEKNLGHATAYGYAKSKGYSGTEDEFAQLMADYASVGQSAAESAEQAAASATSASGSATTASQAAQTATSKASEAVTAADTANIKASEASTSADTASAAATSAGTSAQTATTAASTATTKADAAAASEAAALSAKTDAESARDAAAQSASEAAASAESIDPDEFDRKIYASFATDTASGAIAHFTDGADDIPMKDVLVHIEPVQAGSGDPSPDNVRPITGWTGAKVTRVGKNLCPLYTQRNSHAGISYDITSEGIHVHGTASGSSYSWSFYSSYDDYPIHLNAGTYKVSIDEMYGDSMKDAYLVILGKTLSRQDIQSSTVYSWVKNRTLILTEPTAIQYGIFIASGSTVDFTVKPQIELGSTATAYEPYQGDTYSITFPSEAGTVYGGTLNVTKGELVVDRAQIASYNGEALPSTWISDRDVYASGTTPTIGAQVVYKLASPITYHLTPQEITSLLGTNNLWADTGDTEVEYRADAKLYITKKITEAVSALS